jgi:hypothetical protein
MTQIKRLIVGCWFLLLMALNASADQTVPNGKWWLDSNNKWWYVNSSMQNIQIPDGALNGNQISSFYRRSGEVIVIEWVPDGSHSTGSFFAQNSLTFCTYYGIWSDDRGSHGRYAADYWSDSTNGAWAILWSGRTSCMNLQASSGQWVSADNGGGSTISAYRPAPYAWEEFTMWARGSSLDAFGDGDEVVLGTRDRGYYVCAEGGGGQPIVANRTGVGAWEVFIIHKIAPGPNSPNDRYIRSGDKVALTAANGQYWSADNGGGSGVTANRDGVGAWETFTIQFVRPEPH